MSEAVSSQWGYSSRFCQSGPDSNGIFFKRTMLSCSSVDAPLTQDRQNWHAVNWPYPGCSFITFNHKSRLADFTPVWWSRESVAALALLPKELSAAIQRPDTQCRNVGSIWEREREREASEGNESFHPNAWKSVIHWTSAWTDSPHSEHHHTLAQQ